MQPKNVHNRRLHSHNFLHLCAMQCTTTQCSAMDLSAMHYILLYCNSVQCSAVQFSVVQYSCRLCPVTASKAGSLQQGQGQAGTGGPGCQSGAGRKHHWKKREPTNKKRNIKSLQTKIFLSDPMIKVTA